MNAGRVIALVERENGGVSFAVVLVFLSNLCRSIGQKSKKEPEEVYIYTQSNFFTGSTCSAQ